MDRLLLVNFEEDPDSVYVGFEPQGFQDEVHGEGLLVIAWRTDGRVDVYHQPTLRLDPATYSIAGAGLAHMEPRSLDGAYLEMDEGGVRARFAFVDVLGREVEVEVREAASSRRRPFGLLAPMGHAATSPDALPLVFLHDFYFVPRRGSTVSIRVDGAPRRPDRLPVPMDGARMYFLRYSPEPLIATWNPKVDGALEPLEWVEAEGSGGSAGEGTEDGEGWMARSRGVTYRGETREGYRELRVMSRREGVREVTVEFAPALPELALLQDGARVRGAFLIRGDSPSLGMVTGEYEVTRMGRQLTVTAVPSGGWTPNEGKWSVRFMYRMVPVFREWPTTYRWESTLELSDDGGAAIRGAWSRTPPPA